MASPHPVHHILIDFENVPQTSLAPVAGMEVEITLLLGEKNKKLDVSLVEHLISAGPRVQVVRVGATGRNALDLTLAYYLGRAAATSPHTHFTIVSKDQDYDAMIAHARTTGLLVDRCESTETLSFLKKPAARVDIPAERPKATPRPPTPAEAIVAHFRDHPKNRPRKRTTLISYIMSQGMQLSEAKSAELVNHLATSGSLSIAPNGSVTYKL